MALYAVSSSPLGRCCGANRRNTRPVKPGATLAMPVSNSVTGSALSRTLVSMPVALTTAA
ncbi:Uncharacterised protein [Mycobacteroides abscessus subsp. abscessus]|nr:Uncharacterised protein [Mycobacteroides abscessus subsp. abscessus]